MTALYALSALADMLPISSVTFDIQRNDEISGMGDGRLWQTELAPPLWKADIGLEDGPHDRTKQIAALIRALHGAQYSFWLYDPLSKYPQSDPTGQRLGRSLVYVSPNISTRTELVLEGLPEGYVLTPGDKIQIAFDSSRQRSAFLEVSQMAVANRNGKTNPFAVFPPMPVAVIPGLPVTLIRPACLMVIATGSHNPGRAQRSYTAGSSLSVLEKKTP